MTMTSRIYVRQRWLRSIWLPRIAALATGHSLLLAPLFSYSAPQLAGNATEAAAAQSGVATPLPPASAEALPEPDPAPLQTAPAAGPQSTPLTGPTAPPGLAPADPGGVTASPAATSRGPGGKLSELELFGLDDRLRLSVPIVITASKQEEEANQAPNNPRAIGSEVSR